ncbi:MAG: hypothetical protein JWN98_936 [Abditibacteriota bacterium]|nr:hypothetical protein [Abditibacteriota bacterium]
MRSLLLKYFQPNALLHAGRFRAVSVIVAATLIVSVLLGLALFKAARAQEETLSVERSVDNTAVNTNATPAGISDTSDAAATPDETAAPEATPAIEATPEVPSEDAATNEVTSGITVEATPEAPTSTATAQSTLAPDASATPLGGAVATTIAAPRTFGRTILLLMGGVTWDDFATISSQSNASMPGLQRLLNESALASARLRGVEPMRAPFTLEGARHDWEASPRLDPALRFRVRPSSAILRAAATLNSGLAAGFAPPELLAATYGLNEKTGGQTPSWEDAAPAVAWARRTAGRPQAQSLVNLGWGAALGTTQFPATQSAPPPGDLRRQSAAPWGLLGEIAHAARGRSVAFGSADTTLIDGRGTPLREWATTLCDSSGEVDGGDVSTRTLARDLSAPFGVRADVSLLLRNVDTALADSQTALIAIEWGDTRRAALYAPWCRPDIGASYRANALQRADGLVRALMSRLADRDRLLLIAVPDLDTTRAQWLPIAYWQPQRGTPGALLRVRGARDGDGTIALESLTTLLAARLGQNGLQSDELNLSSLAPIAEPAGTPAPSAQRLGRLLAMQSGLDWLQTNRRRAHVAYCALWMMALGLSLWAIFTAAPRRTSRFEDATMNETSAGEEGSRILGFQRRRREALRRHRTVTGMARDAWIVLMLSPALLWLLGLCLEASWRLGLFVPPSGTVASGTPSVVAMFVLVSVAVLTLGILGAFGGGFAGERLNRGPLGIVWFALTVLGLIIGGFVLPWNETLHAAGHDAGRGNGPRVGDVWSLLWIGATLCAAAGLSRPRPSRRSLLYSQSTLGESETRTVRRVVNVRPSLLWLAGVLVILWLCGGNTAATLVAVVTFGLWALRVQLERLEREERLPRRRWVVIAAVALGVLLLWQRGGSWWLQSTLALWWPAWRATWSSLEWRWAFFALCLAGLVVALPGRHVLRAYLRDHYTSRLMLAATGAGGVVALLLFGPMGPVLLALYPAGALLYDLLDFPRDASSPAS